MKWIIQEKESHPCAVFWRPVAEYADQRTARMALSDMPRKPLPSLPQVYDPDAYRIVELDEADAVAAEPESAGAPTRRPKLAEHRAAFEALLRERNVPYVAVDEAKRAIFRDAKLRAFDYIVYPSEGDNWLVLVGKPDAERRAGMRGWEDTFGPGFRAVFAVPRDGSFVYRTLDGQPVSADALAGADSAATAAGA